MNTSIPPNRILLAQEASIASAEMASHIWLRSILHSLPYGDGHPVIFIPGFLGSGTSTYPMRSLFNRLGYKSEDWGFGRNAIVDEALLADLAHRVQATSDKYSQEVSLVGWSLGGVLAREVAKLQPLHIRNVISLGSPLSDDPRCSRASLLFKLLNRNQRANPSRSLQTPPPVPTSSVFSKTDGIVSWQSSIQDSKRHAKVENIIVPASHLGMGLNPLTMYVLADRLRQTKSNWGRFEATGIKKLAFKSF